MSEDCRDTNRDDCCVALRKKLYLFTIFFSSVDLATRSLSGDWANDRASFQ
jgi:hypothetical protein